MKFRNKEIIEAVQLIPEKIQDCIDFVGAIWLEVDYDPRTHLPICAVGKPNGEILVYFCPPNSDRLHGFSFSINK